MTRTVWDVLGVAETHDVAAIRSAYAKVLKTIDVDAEPHRYIELRNARDQAVYDARVAAAAASEDEPASDPIATIGQPRLAVALGTFEEHVAALAGLLMPDPDGAASAADDGLVLAHFHALLRDPRMAEIAFAARAETQLAELIAMALPRSTVLVEPAITAFGWTTPVNVDTPAAIAAIRDAAESFRQGQPLAAAPGADTGSDTDLDVAFRAAEYAALVALLVPQEESPPPMTRGQEDAARHHFESLLVDPRMDVVTFRVGAEAQLAQLIAYAIPRSDVVVERAIDFFDWRMEEGRVDQASAVAFILNRDRGLRFRAAVLRPDHPHHVAWTELTTPVGVKGRFRKYVPDTSVEQLLTAIRFEQPLLEQELDPGRVAMWDQKLAKRRPIAPTPGRASRNMGARIWLGVVIAMGVLSTLGHLTTPQDQYNSTGFETTPAPPSDVIGGQSTAIEDIGPVLAEIGGRDLTLSALHFSNPALANELEAIWNSAHEQQVDITDFQRGIEKMLLGRIASAVLTTDDLDLVVDYQKLRLGELKRRMAVPQECVDLGQPGKVAVNDLPTELSDDQKELFAKILSQRYWQNQAQPAADTAVDDDIVKAVATKMGVTPEKARQTLAGKAGSVIERCFVRIAELEVLLALPNYRSAPILRAL